MKQHWIVGVDEAGRGPLAGPVYVGVYAIPYTSKYQLKYIANDSKQLTIKKRESFYSMLKAVENAKWHTSYTTAKTIDAIGIVRAINRAVQRALNTLLIVPNDCSILLDGGLHAPYQYVHQTTVIHGDAIHDVIGAASILAKVDRDAHMCRLAKKYPYYALEKHKGYGTAEHRKYIQQHGLSPIHRKTFCTGIKNCSDA
jgi:ribonuclease HII